MKNIIVVYLCYIAVINSATALTSKSSVEGKLIYNVKVHSDLSPPEYDTLARHKRYLYSISEVSESGEQIPFCTGVSLTAICILTAAHCMQKYEKANNYTKLRVANNKKSHEVLTSESHVDYKTGFSEFTDICILKQAFYGAVATLPTRDSVFEPQNNVPLLGWISPDDEKRTVLNFNFINVNIVSEDACTRFLNENNVMLPRQLKNYLLCAIPSTDKVDLDKADIGSPVFLNGEVVGILGQKYLHCFEGVFILTNVSKHLRFIYAQYWHSMNFFRNFITDQPLPPRRNRPEH